MSDGNLLEFLKKQRWFAAKGATPTSARIVDSVVLPWGGGRYALARAAVEVDGYADWKINANFTATFVLAYAKPQKGFEQATGRTHPFSYGMVYVAYAY